MERSFLFNAILDQNGNPDRVYLAEDFTRYFAKFIGNGVFPNPSTNLQVIANDNMTVTLRKGPALINGHLYENTDDLIFKLDPADGVLSRIDRVVIRLDLLNREIKAILKKGTFASSPVASTLQRDSDIHELALADIEVKKGVIAIIQSNITDLRLSNLCGFVHGTVERVDTETLFLQYQDWYKRKTEAFQNQFEEWFNTNAPDMANQFNVWFNYIKDRLEGIDVAQLTLEFDQFKATKTDVTSTNLLGDIKGTTQKVEFIEGKPSKVIHMGGGKAVRTDIFDYSKEGFIIETRTLSTGESITYKYNLKTLDKEVI